MIIKNLYKNHLYSLHSLIIKLDNKNICNKKIYNTLNSQFHGKLNLNLLQKQNTFSNISKFFFSNSDSENKHGKNYFNREPYKNNQNQKFNRNKKYESSKYSSDTSLNKSNYNNTNQVNKFKQKNTNKKAKEGEFDYKIQHFSNSASKYSIKHDPDEILRASQGKPSFLDETIKSNKIKVDIGGYVYKNDKESKHKAEKLLKPGKRMTLQRKPRQLRLSKMEKLELRRRRNLEEKEKTRLLSKEEKKLLANNETAVNRYDPNYWAIEKKKLSQEIQEIKKERRIEAQRIFNPEDLGKFEQTERLSKRLARLGVASRRQAEKLIGSGMIKVDGSIVKSNVPVNENSKIQVFSNQEYKTPVDASVKVWLFYKPTGYVSDAKDERKRPTIYQFLAKKGFTASHFIPVGKLDYSSEGLMILTNNGDMASALESNNSIERAYKIRFFGRMFSQEKLEKIRRGVMINRRLVKFWVETIRHRHTNSWIHLKSNYNSISDIRNIFERLSLRINRIIRTEYGPFRMGKIKNPGDVVETYIPKSLNTYMHYRYKEKLQKSLRKLDDTKLEVIKEQMLKDQRRKLLIKSNKLKNEFSRRLDKSEQRDKNDLKIIK